MTPFLCRAERIRTRARGRTVVRLAAAILVAIAFSPSALSAVTQSEAANTLTVNMPGVRESGFEQQVSFSTGAAACFESCTRDIEAGTVVTLSTAIADTARITFTGWSGSGCSGTGTCTVTMSAARTVTATFVKRPRLEVHVQNAGTVTSSPAGLDCTGSAGGFQRCWFYFAPGATVTLTATPQQGDIVKWHGGPCNNLVAKPCTLTLTDDLVMTALFSPARTLTVAKIGSGTVTDASVLEVINCGALCSAKFPEGDFVQLQATPDPGWDFLEWTGGCGSQSGDCFVTMDIDRTITAKFVKTQALDVSVTGTGSGSVTSSPAGINCGADCTQRYVQGTQVTLSAVPTYPTEFAGWSGGCTGTGPCTVTLNADVAVTAMFRTPTVTVVKTGAGAGRVTSQPSGIDCGSICTGTFNPQQGVILTATPDPGSVFAGWTGVCSSGLPPNVCYTQAIPTKTLTANFILGKKLTVTTVAGGVDDKVTIDPGATVCKAGAPCESWRAPGSVVQLTASPGEGTRFTGWSGGDCSGSSLTCMTTVNDDQEITATFVALHTVTVAKTGRGSGTVTSAVAGIDCGTVCTGQYAHGTPLTLTATPAPGSTFAGWSGAGCSGTGTCVIADADATVTAVFVAAAIDGPPAPTPTPTATATPTPTPTATATPTAGPKPATIRATVTGRRKGKRVVIKLKLTGVPASTAKTRVTIELLKGTRKIATASGTVRSGRAQLTLRAKRALAKGRYRVRVRVRQATTTTLAPVSLKLR
ncbi:MAG: hypothetical protein JWO02_3212 [Solirubrobacterales bacterium]|nr:hypothetical protein [Solirubrobacterales bacterium]